MKRVYWFLKIKVRFLATLLLCFAAVYVVAGRILFMQLPEYHQDIVTILSSELGRPVSIESIEGHWSGFDPVVQLNQLRISGKQAIEIDAINVRLGLLASLRAGTVRLRSLELLNTTFEAVQHPDRWQIAGYDLAMPKNAVKQTDSAMLAFLEGTNISFIDTRVTVLSNGGDQRQWRLPSVSLRYQGDDVYASGQVVEPGSLSPLMSISFHGDRVLSEQPVRGEIYLEARSVDFLDTVLSTYTWQGMSVKSVDASGRFWANFENFALLDLQGEIQASRLDWMVNAQQQAPIRNLTAQFLWRDEAEGQMLALNNLAWNWRQLHCQSSNGVLNQSADRTQIYLDRLEVGCLNGLVLASDLPQGILFDRLNISQPQGQLQHINLQLNTGAEARIDNTSAPVKAAPESVALRAESSEPQEPASREAGGRGAANKQPSRKPDHQIEMTSSQQRDQTGVNESSPASGSETEASAFLLEANLSDVALAAYESTPSAAGIDGYLYADEQNGRVEFKSTDFALGFPDLFLEGWQLKRAQGVVHWRIRGEDVDIYSDGLQLVLPDQGLIYGDFLLRLNDDSHEDYLGLSIGLQSIPFEQVVRFVPYHEIDSELYKWLEQGLQSGLVTNGVYFGYGSVEEDDSINSYTSSLQVDVENGRLKFDPEWPLLERLNAHIELQDDELDVVADRASIRDTELFGLKVQMPSAPEGEYPVLEARAKALTQGSNLEYWITESPVAEHTAALSEALEIEGVLEVDIDIAVPMGDEDTRYDVETRFKDNRISHGLSGLVFTSLQGTVKVSSETGVTAQAIHLNVFDRPATLDITSPSPDAPGPDVITSFHGELEHKQSETPPARTRLTLNSKTDIERILKHFEMASVPGLSGELGYQALLDIYHDEAIAPELRIRSQLEGVTRDWPAPLAKAADSTEMLVADIRFESDSTKVKAMLDTIDGGHVDAHLSFKETVLESTDILLGDAVRPYYQKATEKGLAVHGLVRNADLQAWLDFIDTLKQQLASDRDQADLIRIDLGIQSLSAFGQQFDDLSVTTKPQDSGYALHVLGKQLEGDIFLPDEARSLSLDLERIHLKTDEEAASDTAEQNVQDESEAGIDPRDIPALSFATRSLVLNGQDYGRWSMVFVPQETGVRLQKLKGTLGGIKFEGQLNWSQETLDRTFLDLAFTGKDAEVFFSAIGKPAPLSSKSLKGDLALVWQAAPYDFNADKLSGSFDVEMKDGFLHTSDEKTGALRLLGIFNADALARRLKLDFSDIYKSGIGYDELNMKSKIDQGTLRFEQPMTIKGPSSKYEISGSSNLAKRSLDLDMYVELPFSSNVPLAALMLGAPQVGGAVWLVDKLLGEPLSSITSLKYRVKGTWDEPKLELK